jgi:cation diffusion facilitator family transporter
MIQDINHQGKIERISIIGLIINLLLAALKLILGLIGKSQAVVADALHSFSDVITDLTVIIGVKYWIPPADDRHPYGHKKIETVVTLIIGILLVMVGFEIIINAIKTIPAARPQTTLWIAAIAPLVSIIVKEFLYHWTVFIGKKVKSTALIANAWHHRSDALSSIPVFLAVTTASVLPQYSYVDQIGAVIVAFFIFKVAWDITKPAYMILIDSGASQKEIDEISRIALSVKGVKSIHKIRTRKISDNYFVDLHVQVNGLLTVIEGHHISEEVKSHLVQKGPDIIDVVVHLEPFDE